jgi:DNA-binding transcriptional MocR family regulator
MIHAASVASDIIRGDLSPGDQIPSRVSLARKYGVSAPTASKAVRLLASIGAAELDGNAYWVSNRVPAALLKEEKATTPLHRRERPLPRCLISVIHDPRRLIRCQRKDAMTNRSNEVLHPVSQMTTFELTDLRGTLEDRLAMPTLPPGSLPRGKLQQQLSEVIAEQDDRTRIRRAGTHA